MERVKEGKQTEIFQTFFSVDTKRRPTSARTCRGNDLKGGKAREGSSVLTRAPVCSRPKSVEMS
eukprot:959944-Amorphochlora_amoeboformis.AAC.1